MNRLKAITSALEWTYGKGPMVRALADHLDEKWEEFEEDEYRDELHVCIWNFFAGGTTAEIAANRVRKAVEESQ